MIRDDRFGKFAEFLLQRDMIVPSCRLTEVIVNLMEDLAVEHPRDMDVLVKYFGLDGMPRLSLGKIGKCYGVSRPRISQIKSRGIRRLRHPGRLNRIREVVGMRE